MTMLQSLFSNIAPFFILLGLLIFVHELGHFLVAKFFGVRVETFSLGFGKKILSFKRGDTTYCLSLIPLGGYVKMYGDDPTADVPSEERKYAFLHKPVMQRIWIVLAGPLMNLFFAIFIFILIATIGDEVPGPVVGDVAENSKAYEAGFRSGDKILSVNGEETPTWSLAQKRIEASAGKALEFKIERKGEAQLLQIQASASIGENENIFSANRQVGQIQGLTQESRSALVGIKDPQSPAAQAGMQSLDLIVSIDGQKINYWRDIQPTLLKALPRLGEQVLEIQVRSVTDNEKSTSPRTLKVAIPKGWNEKSDLADLMGFEPAELYIYQIKKGSPAANAGLQPKDRVVTINGEDMPTWSSVLAKVKSFDPASEGMEFGILRNGELKNFKIRPEMTKVMTMKGQEEKRFTIGIVSGFLPAGPEPVIYRVSGFTNKIAAGLRETANWTEFIVMSMVRLVQGDVSPKNIGGVITIGRVASHSFEAGLATFLKTMAIISINLFLLNLLPIPILDGGHLVFYTIEGLRGSPLSMRKMELAQQVGLMLLMLLMVFSFFNDITNFFFSRW